MSSNEKGPDNDQPSNQNNDNPKSNIVNDIDNQSKDKIISQLKAKLSDLKQKQKDHESLNQRYKQLINDFSILNEAKLRIEYEIKQREKEYNQRISDLKGENELIKLGLNDRMSNTNNILSQNDIKEKEIRLKDDAINNLKDKAIDLSNQIDSTQIRNQELVKTIDNLSQNNKCQNEQICRLRQDNKCLAMICQDNEKTIKNGIDEIHSLSQKINENCCDINNLNEKILCHANIIKNMQNKINYCNDMNIKLHNNIQKYEKEFEMCRNENNGLKNDILTIRNLRNERENKNEQLKKILNEKETQISQLCHDNDKILVMNRDYNNCSNKYKIQNEKLRQQVKLLDNQNQNIINEIDNILNEDRRMKELLRNKDNISPCLHMNNRFECTYGGDYLRCPYNSYNNKDYNSSKYTYQYKQ
jgi:chromosome segregation ATPase